ncbi:MAG TPA: alpha/beta fold hydrolase [Parvibaculum sp.]
MAILKGVVVVTAAFLLIMMVGYWAAGRARPMLDAASRAALLKAGLAHAFLDLPDGTVHYRLEGPESGPLIVLIHGFSTPSFVWDDYFKPLTSAGYRVLAYDNYGRGFSDRPNTKYDADLSDRLLLNLLDKLGLDAPAHIVGYSMGGATAAIFAARHPDRVRSLTLIAPAGLGVATSRNLELMKRPVIGDWIVRMFGLKIFHAAAAEEAKAAPNPADFLTDFDRQMDYRGYGDALLSTLRYYPLATSETAYADAGRSPRPVLVIWGEADATVPFSNAKRLIALMPRARLYSYPQLGHNIGFSQAPMITGLMLEFLNAQGPVPTATDAAGAAPKLGVRELNGEARPGQ